ncbi:MAG: Asp-tRNA(Asn)/Glu-tRNA(Gln) amidotransferase subunit GatB [bacterium]|nr:Asp-tRNA(Asn)/Glu-tRNA(Gln) amidotransferase subunit GatB [bacterium]
MSWEVVIGLEVHVQLNTKSKIFSGSATTFGAEPNTQASLIDLGMPGVLPVLNKGAVRNAIKFGLGIDAELGRKSVFARKNYFYPDLPKGYQISQMDLPIVGKGHLDITLEDGTVKRIGITRAHLEEDAGKSLHEDFSGMTGIDLNRAGTPLLEIVSEPDMRSAKEAVAYARAIHALIRYLDISDGNMAEGSMRCDCNVSVRKKGTETFGTRREIKNVNSFKFIEKAINVEIEWQIDELESGRSIRQDTVLYDVNKNETRSMRSKEEANDYRYFPDPDLLPVILDEAMIEEIRATLPELPAAKRERFIAQFGLPDYDAGVLVSSRDLADFFEATVNAASGAAKQAANWVMGDLLGALNKAEKDISASPISAQQLGGMIMRITDNTISGKIAKQVFQALMDGEGDSADAIIEKKGLKQETDSGAIEALIDAVIADNTDNVAAYRSGKDKLFGFFVGEVMKRSKGKANPGQVNELLKSKLAG